MEGKMDVIMDKSRNPKPAFPIECKRCRQVDTMSLEGVDYDIRGLPLEELVQDIANDVPADEMKKKWGLEERKRK
ncbi:hypothetical protein BDV25DRAFT_138604 [Aspergillus avenaceus]|uniref:Uncharacterized protein n=1 Tax=Aspergillus avenaceus TaxID=36643 RepID=A0A5N6U0A3_ASPAV|nr:hypothetical protein BDV25DRAFT_138604 [Aspergillus avenaceus]